jgi:putative endonuclease
MSSRTPFLVAPMYFVYIIETEDGTYYTGMTNDVARRFQEHLSGNSHSAAYLKVHQPVYVVFLTECETQRDAMKLEQQLKKDYKFKMAHVGPRRDIREVIDSELSYR